MEVSTIAEEQEKVHLQTRAILESIPEQSSRNRSATVTNEDGAALARLCVDYSDLIPQHTMRIFRLHTSNVPFMLAFLGQVASAGKFRQLKRTIVNSIYSEMATRFVKTFDLGPPPTGPSAKNLAMSRYGSLPKPVQPDAPLMMEPYDLRDILGRMHVRGLLPLA